MSRVLAFVLAIIVVTAAVAAAGEPPRAGISNKEIVAGLYLPDPVNGYYRATRFDWSGSIYSLKYKGHEYFGQWFPKYDPKINDATMGPVEEYKTGDSALGYEEAKVGGKFIRIGVGAVRKPNDRRFASFTAYEIVNPGKWTVREKADRIEFTHTLTDDTGYAYLYKKTVRLVKDKPEMVLEHSLKNTGRKPIVTSMYNHNFFMIDHQPAGPDFAVRFPFYLKAPKPMRGDAGELRGREIVYLRELRGGQSVYTELEGFGPTAADYDIRIENRKAGAGVRIVGDRPLSKMVFWSIRTTVCPEPYIDLKVEPGREEKWTIRYEFYTMPPGQARAAR